MRNAVNNTIAEILAYDVVGGPVSKPVIKTEYSKDNGVTWHEFEDVEAREIKLGSENKRYQSYSFMPPVKEMNLTLNNFNQPYSTGSGDPKASILDKNVLIRCWSGYELATGSEMSDVDDFSSNTKFVHVRTSGGKLYSDVTSYTGTWDTAAGIDNFYDSNSYGSTTYEYLGYYKKAFDLGFAEVADPMRIEIVSSSNKFAFKYRVSDKSTFTGSVWGQYQQLATGTNVFNLTADEYDRYTQMILRFDATDWSTADNISSITLYKYQKTQLFQQGVFIIDDPEYNEKVSVKGRDYLRRALETEIQVPTCSNRSVTNVLADALDRCGVPYATATWQIPAINLSLNATLAEDMQDASGWQVIDYCMDAINATADNYIFRFNGTGQAEVKLVQTDSEADFIAHYFYNIEDISKSFDGDKQLQRATVVNKDIPVNAETLLRTLTGTTASTTLYATHAAALYVRYEDDNSIITAESSRTNTACAWTVNSGAAYTVRVYGCTPKNAITEEVWGEAGNSDNIINGNGSTYKKINPYLDATLCKRWAEKMRDNYSTPAKKITLTMVAHPLLELNDKIAVFDKYTYTDDIYNLTEIVENYSEPALKQTLTMRDASVDLGSIVYDRNGVNAGVNDILYDSGIVYDMDISISAQSDTASYANTKEVQFS